MSILRKISIKNAIQQAQDNMGIDHNRDIPLFTQWAVEADRKIGSYYSYKRKIVILHVENCRAELPCETMGVLGVVFGDRGTKCDTLFHQLHRQEGGLGWMYSDFWGEPGCCRSMRYEIQNNHLVFSGNFHTLHSTLPIPPNSHHDFRRRVTVEILALETDQEGFPLINENHVDAVSQYIEYKQALRTRWNSIENKITETGIADMKMEWGRKCRDARADSGEPSQSDLQEIKNMINDPISGVGIHLLQLNNVWNGWY